MELIVHEQGEFAMLEVVTVHLGCQLVSDSNACYEWGLSRLGIVNGYPWLVLPIVGVQPAHFPRCRDGCLLRSMSHSS